MKIDLVLWVSLAVLLICLVFVSGFEVTLKPFNIKVHSPYLGLSVLFLIIAISLHSLHYRNLHYIQGYKDAMQDAIKEIKEARKEEAL